LEHWQRLGLLSGLPDDRSTIPQLPDWQDKSSASVERRARCWLDVNCSHCHNPRGAASTSGLDLTFEQAQPVRFGVYKPPVAAGRGSQGLKFSVVPRRPDESFMVRRINSTELGIMMPPLGRTTVHHAGVGLIREWIAGMEVDEALAEAALNPMKAYKDAINGGEAELGSELFHKVQKCITCHRVGDVGGSIGPNLSDVGKRTKRAYLLESIVVPSAKIVKGYETQVVVLADGRVVTGTVQSEDEYEVVIADARTQTKIEKDDIDDRVASNISTMPSLANLLTVDDVRNLIAYLVTLRETPPD
jgi:putative heme-binding domain-containing protein